MASASIDLYKKAFEEFSKHEGKFELEPGENRVYVTWNGEPYVVAHIDDLKQDYKDFFEKASYDELGFNLPAPLLQSLIDEETEWMPTDFIVDVFRQWDIYWNSKREEIKGGTDRYKAFKEQSWKELHVLFEVAKLDMTSVMSAAERINDDELVPIIAMALIDQFDGLDTLIDKILEYVTEEYNHIISSGMQVHTIYLGPEDEEPEVFFIYESEFEFKEADGVQ